MLSKKYYLEIIARILLFLITVIVMSFCWFKSFFIWGVVIAICVLIQAILLIKFLNKTNRNIAYFFNSLENEDFSMQIPETVESGSLEELYRGLNKVKKIVKETQIKVKEQESYYQEILKQVKIGVLMANEKGHILFANHSAKKILNISQLNHINQLKKVDLKLYKILSDLKPFERKSVQFINERETINLIVKLIKIELKSEALNLITVQNIKNELDEKETDSWVKLLKVSIHEIMNMVTPLSSISESILKYFEREKILINGFNESHLNNTIKGLNVIKKQSEGLLNFVKSYRDFLNIPKPDKKVVNVNELLEEVKLLSSQEIELETIMIHIKHISGEVDIFADEKQITLVLLNLLKNAKESLKDNANGTIEMISGINKENIKFIKVKDNGEGIPPEVIEQIFVPFFTTKSSGSGVGLSLSRQIMLMHEGNLTVVSTMGKGTVLTLTF